VTTGSSRTSPDGDAALALRLLASGTDLDAVARFALGTLPLSAGEMAVVIWHVEYERTIFRPDGVFEANPLLVQRSLYAGAFEAYSASLLDPSVSLRPEVAQCAMEHGFAAVRVAPLLSPGTINALGAVVCWLREDAPIGAAEKRIRQAAQICTLGLVTDLAQRWSHHTMSHDALTGLANRRELATLLEGIRGSTAFLRVDLRSFERVNEQFGQLVGDEVLVAVGKRLANLLRPHDSVIRLGGDDFLIVCPAVSSLAVVNQLGRRMGTAITTPVKTPGGAVHVEPSFSAVIADSNFDEALVELERMLLAAREAPGGEVIGADLRSSSARLARRQAASDSRPPTSLPTTAPSTRGFR
jgi:diguanylate cyclase (GGDEF)-like protein